MASPSTTLHKPAGKTALTRTAALWLSITLLGQWVFAYFIIGFYGSSTLQGHFEEWTKNTALIKGYVPGDTAGNWAFAAHMLLAAIITLGGVLQLVPQIRARAIAFHRWNGRVFMLAVMAASIGGLYLTWVRGTSRNFISALAISGDALLIIVFAVLAWRTARARDLIAHRRWALRTFVVAGGVWFMRLGYFGWILINQAPVGITKTMDGAFDRFIAFGCYLVPLAVLELYLRVKDAGSPGRRFWTAGVLFVSTLLMTVGIVGATLFLWMPLLAKV
nr:DUF2306 domain-containing protein [Rhodoferax sp.]